jgi:hypothetical protein
MNTNQAQWNPATPRKSVAAIAAVAATLVFTSVIGLFASDNPPAGVAAVASTPTRQIGPSSNASKGPTSGRLASNSATSSKL